MLIYHPAFDAYHCVFRMLALIDELPGVEVDLLRICDFYLVFPAAISNVRLPQSLSHGKRIAKAESNTYRDPLNPKLVFRDMEEIQLAALRSIAASGIIDRESFKAGFVRRNGSTKIPIKLLEKLSEFSNGSQSTFRFLVDEFSTIPLRGLNGIKHRTELLEYRYDTSEANN